MNLLKHFLRSLQPFDAYQMQLYLSHSAFLRHVAWDINNALMRWSMLAPPVAFNAFFMLHPVLVEP